MKCAEEKVAAFIERPDLSLSGALIYGEDSFLVGTNKRALMKSALGENAGDDLYVLTLDPARVKRDEELVHAVLTSRSLLPGRQVALLESATNEHTKSVARALEDPDPEDAFLIVVSGDLKAQSSLRKLFESSPKAIAVPSVARPPTGSDLRQRFRKRNMPAPTADALDRLVTLAGEMSWGEFESLFEKLCLYTQESGNETTVADIDACAPLDRTVQVDELVDALADGRPPRGRSPPASPGRQGNRCRYHRDPGNPPVPAHAPGGRLGTGIPRHPVRTLPPADAPLAAPGTGRALPEVESRTT